MRTAFLAVVLAVSTSSASAALALPQGGLLESLRREAKSADPAIRSRAYQSLLDLGHDGVVALGEVVREKEAKDVAALLALAKSPEATAFKGALKKLIKPAQDEALAAIRDRKAYPEENHGRAGQSKVDEKVDALRRLFEEPARIFIEKTPAAQARVADLEETLRYLKLAKLEPSKFANAAEAVAALNEAFDVPALAAEKSSAKRNAEVMAWNEDAITSATEEEREFVRILNRYRMMLGLSALELDERLVVAARKHSQEMQDLDYFAHVSPVKENETVDQRVAKEGFKGWASENCAVSESAQDAFNGWYNSSGHHRNMIGESFRQIGAGHSVNADGTPGRLWTMNPGSADSLMGKKKLDPRETLVSRRAKLRDGDAKGRLTLAAWCREKGFPDDANELLRQVIAIDPENERARKLLGHAKDESGSWADREQRLLGAIETLPEAEAVERAAKALKSENPEERIAAIRGLEKRPLAKSATLLVRALDDPASEVRSAAAAALAATQARDSRKSLVPLLKDRSLYVRHAAARALQLLGDPSGIPVLFADLRSDDLNTRIDAHKVAFEVMGRDFGYKWDLRDADRARVVDEWEAWWKETSAAAASSSSPQ